MDRFVRLYPSAWRDRYGDELAALLVEHPPGPFEVADLLLGALDAQLHLRGLGRRSSHRSGIPMSLRLAGFAAAVGGGLWALFFVMVGASYANVGPETGFAWILVVLIGGPVLLTALAGLSATQFRAYPRPIWIAFLLPAAGIGLVLVSLASLPSTGGMASKGTLPALLLYGGLCMMLVGSALFAVVTIATHAHSPVANAAIIVGVLPTLAGLLGVATAIWVAVGGMAFGLGWIGLGVDAVRRAQAPVSVDTAVSAP